VLVGLAAFICSAALFVGGSSSQAGILVEPWIDTSNRDAVAVAYAAEYAAGIPDMAWTGDYDGCRPGQASQRLALATVRRVNYYRAMAGVPAGVGLSDEYSGKAQHAALTMSATGKLSHDPGDDYICLTDTGREAAANSNLYLGRTGPAAIDGYIEDPGDRNRDVGHRNTILHPPTTEIGVGHVAGSEDHYPSNALWVFDDEVFADHPDVREDQGFVAWPPRGYVPPALVYPRWSLGLVGADFDQADVAMYRLGSDGAVAVELDVVARHSKQGYVPSPIIVWEPVGELDAAAEFDTSYLIEVTGIIIGGQERDITYTVTVMGDKPSPTSVAQPGNN
jgi:uncharacterized protein YkwD